MKIKAAIFDADGTLLDSMGQWNLVPYKYIKSLGVDADENIAEKLFTMTISEAAEYIIDEYDLLVTAEEAVEGMDEIIREFYQNEVELKEGAREILEYFKEPSLIKKGEFRAGEGDLDELNLDSKTKIDTSTIEYTSLNLPIVGENMDPNPPMPKSLVDAKIGDEIPLPSELVGTWINKEPNNGTRPGRASSLILGEDGSYTGTFKDGDIRGKLSRLKKVSDNGFIVLKENNDGEAFFFSVGLGAVLSPGERIDFGMVLEGRNLYNASWLVKEGEEDYSKPTMLATFVNPNYGPKKIEKKAEQDVAKQGDTVADSTQDSSEETKPEQKLFGKIPVFGLVVGAALVLVLILSIFWFKK